MGRPGGTARLVIATVGDNTIDRYVGDESARYAGGNAVNVAAQLAAHGSPVAYFGAVGADANARTITRGLHRAGVDRIVENDANSSMVTTWTVTPAGPDRSVVAVESSWQGAGCIAPASTPSGSSRWRGRRP